MPVRIPARGPRCMAFGFLQGVRGRSPRRIAAGTGGGTSFRMPERSVRWGRALHALGGAYFISLLSLAAYSLLSRLSYTSLRVRMVQMITSIFLATCVMATCGGCLFLIRS